MCRRAGSGQAGLKVSGPTYNKLANPADAPPRGCRDVLRRAVVSMVPPGGSCESERGNRAVRPALSRLARRGEVGSCSEDTGRIPWGLLYAPSPPRVLTCKESTGALWRGADQLGDLGLTAAGEPRWYQIRQSALRFKAARAASSKAISPFRCGG